MHTVKYRAPRIGSPANAPRTAGLCAAELAASNIGSERSHLIDWLRLPGDPVFILFDAVPRMTASIKGYLGGRAAAAATASA